ncbi:MAG: hypothetical protein KDD62_07305, partial [Bdellovibrionales bacterium]|nr:hypothetical protein [Bdellovibrionales bacterium]
KLVVQLVLLGSLSFPAFVAMFVLAASGGPGPYKIAAITMLMWGFGNLATACSGISTLYALRRDGEGFDERYERKNRQQADRC